MTARVGRELPPRNQSEPEGAATPSEAAGILQGGRGFVGAAGITLVGAAAGAVLAMGTEMLAARFLGVATYGLYALALMVAKSGEAVAVFGVPASVMHYLPIQLSRGERERSLGTIVGAILGPLVVGLAFALGGWLGGDWIASHLLGQPGAGRFLAVLGFAIPLMVLAHLQGQITRAFGRALPGILIRNLTPQLCAVVLLAGLFVSRGPQLGVAYAQLIGQIAAAIAGMFFVLQLARVRIGAVRPHLDLAALYGFAAPVALITPMALVVGFTDLFLLGVFTDAGTVGIYRGCAPFLFGFSLLATALVTAIAPLFTVLIAAGRRAPLQEAYAAAIRLQVLLALPLLLIVVVNAGDLLAIMGPGFTGGRAALVVLACGQFLECAFGAAGVALMMGGRQRLEAGNMAITASANLLLNLLLIPAFGLVGAAVATATAMSGLALLRCWQVRRVMALRTMDPVLPRALLVTVPAALAIWWSSTLVGFGPGSGLLPLGVRLAAMAAALAAGLWQFCISREDRAMLWRLALRRPAPVSEPTPP